MPTKPPVHRPAGVQSAAEVKRALDRQRPSAARRGYGPRWRRGRAAFLARHPLCVRCQAKGSIEPSTGRCTHSGRSLSGSGHVLALCCALFEMFASRKSGSDAIQLFRLILTFAAAGLVLLTAFALSARLWWAFDLFSHFRLQYAVIALILCGATLAVRAYPSAAVLAAVALVHGWAIKDLWFGGSAEASSNGVTLRVASTNVLGSNPEPGKVLDFVRATDADVVVLLEARGKRWRDVLSGIGAEYSHRAPESWRDGAPVILFSRHPIVRESVIRSPEGRRPYLAAELALGEHKLTVVGVHPSSPSPKDPSDTRQRNLQLDYLANIIEGAPGPVVVAGDFNTTPWSPHFQDLVATAGLRNAANGHGYIGTWPSWFWPAQIPIDHVLVKGPVVVASMGRGSPTGSDHHPVVADLRLTHE